MLMAKYTFQRKIATLNDLEFKLDGTDSSPKFMVDGVSFTPWDFNMRDGNCEYAWLAETKISARDVNAANATFAKKLARILPRIAFTGGAYVNYLYESFLITKENCDIGYFRHLSSEDPVPLMFTVDKLADLRILVDNEEIPNEFFYYWNDATNLLRISYSARLQLIFSALEALAKKQPCKKHIFLEGVLGKDLHDQIYARKVGLRHRLSHGEYLTFDDTKEDYVKRIWKKVMDYFNTNIFRQTLLNMDIVDPMRTLGGNYVSGGRFLRPKSAGAPLALKILLESCKNSENNVPDDYEWVVDNEATDTF